VLSAVTELVRLWQALRLSARSWLSLVSEVLAELSLEGFEIGLGDGADAADTGGVIARAGGSCGARWQRWEFLSRLGVEDEVDLWLAAVGGGLRDRAAFVHRDGAPGLGVHGLDRGAVVVETRDGSFVAFATRLGTID
jgi:hypothetical protein